MEGTSNIYLQRWEEFKDLLRKLKTSEDHRAVSNEILNFFAPNYKDVITGYLLARFESNVSGKISKKTQKVISFFTSEEKILETLVDKLLLTTVRQAMKKRVIDLLKKCKPLNESTMYTNLIFKREVVIDHLAGIIKNYYYFLDARNPDIISGYLKIYKEYLINELKAIYNKKNIYNIVNARHLVVAKESDFDPSQTPTSLQYNNLRRLTLLLLRTAEEHRRFFSDDDIVIINKVDTVQHILDLHYQTKVSEEEHIEQKRAEYEGIDPETRRRIADLMIKLLKGSVQHEDYIGFFQKDDYIKWVKQRYREIPHHILSKIFDEVTNPKPPVGVTRFKITDFQSPDGKREYFIALDHVPMVYKKLNLHGTYDISRILNIKDRHFLIFLKKLIREFQLLKYTPEHIANILHTDVKTVNEMISTVEKMG